MAMGLLDFSSALDIVRADDSGCHDAARRRGLLSRTEASGSMEEEMVQSE
jgi:hypothetical protein